MNAPKDTPTPAGASERENDTKWLSNLEDLVLHEPDGLVGDIQVRFTRETWKRIFALARRAITPPGEADVKLMALTTDLQRLAEGEWDAITIKRQHAKALLTALAAAPASGVRAGMLRAAEIARICRDAHRQQDERGDGISFYAFEACEGVEHAIRAEADVLAPQEGGDAACRSSSRKTTECSDAAEGPNLGGISDDTQDFLDDLKRKYGVSSNTEVLRRVLAEAKQTVEGVRLTFDLTTPYTPRVVDYPETGFSELRNAPQPDAAPEPVAWIYELASFYTQSTNEYSGWRKHVDFTPPSAGKAQRNVRSLYAALPAPVPAGEVAMPKWRISDDDVRAAIHGRWSDTSCGSRLADFAVDLANAKSALTAARRRADAGEVTEEMVVALAEKLASFGCPLSDYHAEQALRVALAARRAKL